MRRSGVLTNQAERSAAGKGPADRVSHETTMNSNDSGPEKATDRTALYVELPRGVSAASVQELLTEGIGTDEICVEQTAVRNADRRSRAEELVSEYASELDELYSDKHDRRARALAQNAELNEPINRTPASIAAGSIYAAGLLINQPLTQQQVAEVTGVTEPTLRDAYREILESEGYQVVGDEDELPTGYKTLPSRVRRDAIRGGLSAEVDGQ